VLPELFCDETPLDESWLTSPLGSGPYVSDTIDASKTMEFCRGDDYWSANSPVNIAKTTFDCYAYEYFADDTIGLGAFATGK
jgi:microcin C transport system substrate-binding protein